MKSNGGSESWAALVLAVALAICLYYVLRAFGVL